MAGKFRPGPLKPRETIEVSGEHIVLRTILVILLFGISMAGVYFGVKGLLTRDSGWTRVEADSGIPAQATADLDFEYCLTTNATAEYKLLTVLYSETAQRAWQVYHPTQAFTGVKNLQAVNAAPNQEVAVEPELYRAFELVEAKGSRALFLAPVYAQYDAVFRSLEDAEAAVYDPARSQEAAAYVAEVLAFVSDPTAVSLDLLGENRVRLNVREDYLRYAKDNGVEAFLDFYWLKNAFVLDDLAEKCRSQGFTRGYIVSREGFARYLDTASTADYTVQLTDGSKAGVVMAASLRLREGMSLACLHGYSLTDSTADFFYQYADGREVTPYLDLASGESRAAVQDLTLLSRTASCAELALAALPALTAETWDAASVTALQADDVAALWFEGKTLCHTELPAELTLNDASYTERTIR